ncbi:hypothetical protein J437_LFUL000880 [Ladona fulva]|uniref:F5/8 type C domain-containing protein n=1 Tax=Ladona fulva TaxID=123851 RepID=A0A8K0P3W5_LADFU|nr:hypothetical protein J437_LFUL000880 [Ladona fulva]
MNKHELTGNSNTYLVVRQELELPFVASKVRFIPYSVHPRTVCMRVEIYGCLWDQNRLLAALSLPSPFLFTALVHTESPFDLFSLHQKQTLTPPEGSLTSSLASLLNQMRKAGEGERVVPEISKANEARHQQSTSPYNGLKASTSLPPQRKKRENERGGFQQEEKRIIKAAWVGRRDKSKGIFWGTKHAWVEKQ